MVYHHVKKKKKVFKIVTDNVTMEWCTLSSVSCLSSCKTPTKIHGNVMIVNKKVDWYVYKTFEIFHAFVILLGSWVLE